MDSLDLSLQEVVDSVPADCRHLFLADLVSLIFKYNGKELKHALK